MAKTMDYGTIISQLHKDPSLCSLGAKKMRELIRNALLDYIGSMEERCGKKNNLLHIVFNQTIRLADTNIFTKKDVYYVVNASLWMLRWEWYSANQNKSFWSMYEKDCALFFSMVKKSAKKNYVNSAFISSVVAEFLEKTPLFARRLFDLLDDVDLYNIHPTSTKNLFIKYLTLTDNSLTDEQLTKLISTTIELAQKRVFRVDDYAEILNVMGSNLDRYTSSSLESIRATLTHSTLSNIYPSYVFLTRLGNHLDPDVKSVSDNLRIVMKVCGLWLSHVLFTSYSCCS